MYNNCDSCTRLYANEFKTSYGHADFVGPVLNKTFTSKR